MSTRVPDALIDFLLAFCEIVIAVLLKVQVSWDVTLCSLVCSYQHLKRL